jgi:hypothetical protein
MATTRKGKIASLPATVREEVNHRLFDGERGPSILKSLNENPDVLRILDQLWGEEPVTAQNLSEWRQGGYQDWLARREREESIKILADYSLKLAKSSGGSITEGAAAIAGGKILELLEQATEGKADYELLEALSLLRRTEIAQQRTNQRSIVLQQRDRQLLLEEKRFQRQTAELFIKWHTDKRATEIAEGKDSKEIKTDKLVQLIFGDKPISQ